MISKDVISDLYSKAYSDILEPYRVIKNGTPYFDYAVTDQIDSKVRDRFAELLEEYLTNKED
jgi:selenocysteine lyase/cysteine desulfurase